jgi:hypothetical protein
VTMIITAANNFMLARPNPAHGRTNGVAFLRLSVVRVFETASSAN